MERITALSLSPLSMGSPVNLSEEWMKSLVEEEEDPPSPYRSPSPPSPSPPLPVQGPPLPPPPLSPVPVEGDLGDDEVSMLLEDIMRALPSSAPVPTSPPLPSLPQRIQILETWTPTHGNIEPMPDALLNALTQEEKKAYYDALATLATKFPKNEEAQSIKRERNKLRDRLAWKGQHVKKVEEMSLEEVRAYLNDLSLVNPRHYLPASAARIRTAQAQAMNHFHHLNTQIPSPKGNGPTDDPSGDHGDPSDDLNGDDDDDEVRERHKNADQDTVSKAFRTRLDKGDYQTIAKTTTVTTVRKGKRPVVEREHTSTTTPNDDDDEDNNASLTISGGVLSRKRKSRVPKTKARRKKQRGGTVDKYAVVDDYIQFLRHANRP